MHHHHLRAVVAAAFIGCAAWMGPSQAQVMALCTPVPLLPALTIVALSNGMATYCVSDHGWSDAWFVGAAPTVYDPRLDVLSGDDAPNLHFGVRGGAPWPVASGLGWISPVMDGGELSPVTPTGSPWEVVVPVHFIAGSTTAQSLVHHPIGLDLLITTALEPLGQEIRQTFTLSNVSTALTFEDIVFADYFNFHPNGSDADNFRKGSISYSPLGGLLITGPDDGTLIANGSMRGERADDMHGTNATFVTVPDIAIDMVQTVTYPSGLPDAAFSGGPGDVAGGLAWRLPDLAPGESTSFTIFKLAEPLTLPLHEPMGLSLLALGLLVAVWPMHAAGMHAARMRGFTTAATAPCPHLLAD